jgi:hypothetical protein
MHAPLRTHCNVDCTHGHNIVLLLQPGVSNHCTTTTDEAVFKTARPQLVPLQATVLAGSNSMQGQHSRPGAYSAADRQTSHNVSQTASPSLAYKLLIAPEIRLTLEAAVHVAVQLSSTKGDASCSCQCEHTRCCLATPGSSAPPPPPQNKLYCTIHLCDYEARPTVQHAGPLLMYIIYTHNSCKQHTLLS